MRHYLDCLLATGATGVPAFDQVWEHFRRWPVYGMQAWLANQDIWGQAGLPMVERFCTAMEDLDTLALLERLPLERPS